MIKTPELGKPTSSEFLCLILIVLMLGLILYAYPNLPGFVAFFYTLPWGEAVLGDSRLLFFLPLIGLIFTGVNLYLRPFEKGFSYLSVAINIILIWSLFKILGNHSSLWPSAFFHVKNIISPLLLAGLISVIISRPVVKLATVLKIIDDPAIHQHPGMLLKKPTPRAGAVIFMISFLVSLLLLVPRDQLPWGIISGALLYTILGVLDDKFDLNPYVRFGILGVGAILVALSGVGIKFIGLPFGELRLDNFLVQLPMMKESTFLMADFFTVIWILWVSNLLSWSNGIDGQFAGIAGLTALFIALLSLRLIPLDHNQIQTTRIAAICAGAALGMIPVTWHPCKILWGFGATAAGLVLASLAVTSGSKVAVATLVFLVPLLDAIATIIRRLSLKKSPFWGDRGHLHHRLLNSGLNQPQIAVLYYLATIVMGAVAVFLSGRKQILAIAALGTMIVSLLILTNLKGYIWIPRTLKRVLSLPKAKTS